MHLVVPESGYSKADSTKYGFYKPCMSPQGLLLRTPHKRTRQREIKKKTEKKIRRKQTTLKTQMARSYLTKTQLEY